MSASLLCKVSLGVICAVIGIPSHALACSTLPVALCSPGGFTPTSGTLPANAVQWLWTHPFKPGPADADAGTVRPQLYLLANGQRSELPLAESALNEFVTVLRPASEPPAGSMLEIAYAYRCDGASEQRVRALLTVAPPAPRPTRLGTLEPTAGAGAIVVGACGETIDATYVDLRIALSADAIPYRAGFQKTLRIDGELATQLNHHVPPGPDPAPAPSYGGVLRVFASCGPARGELANLALGRHRVQVIGSLPDGTTVASDEREIDLRCPLRSDAGVVDAGADLGVGLPRDAGRVADASLPMASDAASASPGAASPGAALPGSAPPASASRPASRSDDEGCAIQAGGGASVTWLALALGVLLARRKRAS